MEMTGQDVSLRMPCYAAASWHGEFGRSCGPDLRLGRVAVAWKTVDLCPISYS